jgi:Ran GTPase-activating protein (RanGAP) involved in mRNA processing and transport
LDKVRDQNQYNAIKPSVYTAFLNKSESLHLLPAKIGFIKVRGEETLLKCNHYRMGDKYAEVLSEGLKTSNSVSTLQLSNNRLTSRGADLILSQLTKHTQFIDLSNNNIGSIGCSHLQNLLVSKGAKVLELNLEGNKLGDSAIKPLLDAIAGNNTIKKLNISKNFLSFASAATIARMLTENGSIEEFYMRWNQMNGAGGAAIIKGIQATNKMRVLDISWNAFGAHVSTFAQTFADYIYTNETLVHLDISNNSLGQADSNIIATALMNNHTLYGIHYDGNFGYIDPRGFLKVLEPHEQKPDVNFITHSIHGVQANHEFKKHKISVSGEYKECCWICEGWKETEFLWTPNDSGMAAADPIFLHLYHEGYSSVFMPLEDGFKVGRMCPPEHVSYFYTTENVHVTADNQPTYTPKDPDIKFTIQGAPYKAKMEKLNIFANNFNRQMFDPKTYMTKCQVKPRTADKLYIAPELKKERTPWTFPISIFRAYQQETDDLSKKCFDFDWEYCKINKYVKKPEELEQVKQMLRNCYRDLKECYRHYSSVGVVSDIWSLRQMEINEFCKQTGIKDPKLLDEKEIGLVSIKAYTKDKAFAGNPRNPDKAIVRYQMMEFLLRLCEECINKGLWTTFPEALKTILDVNVLPHCRTFNWEDFRKKKYWNEECDTVYKTYLPIIQSTYRKYSGLKTKPGQKKFMCLEELFKMVNEAGLLNDKFVDRDVSVFFCASMQTQVDELTVDRVYQMQFIEFMECLARIADVYAAPTLGEFSEVEIPYEVRVAKPLHYKLEGLIPNLFARTVENIVKESYILPEKSIFDWPIDEQQKAAKVIGRKRTIIKVDPVTRPNVQATAD